MGYGVLYVLVVHKMLMEMSFVINLDIMHLVNCTWPVSLVLPAQTHPTCFEDCLVLEMSHKSASVKV